jgi:hypothetical protein
MTFAVFARSIPRVTSPFYLTFVGYPFSSKLDRLIPVLHFGTMNPKLLSVYLLFVCQSQLLTAEATANETVILWTTVSPNGTYALAGPKTISNSSDSDKAAAHGEREAQLLIVNLQTNKPVLDLSGFATRDFAQLDPTDASSTHSFCAWAPQESLLLVVNALDPLACLQVDLPEGRVSDIGSTLVAAVTRITKRSTTRKTSYSARSAPVSIIDAHFISSHEFYVTANIDSGPGSDARRVDLYFQINAGHSLVFERSEPYPNPNQPIGASILASRQVERLYQTLRGVVNEDDRLLLTMEQQSWLGGRDLLDNYEDRVVFAQTRIAELRQRLKEAIQKKSAE